MAQDKAVVDPAIWNSHQDSTTSFDTVSNKNQQKYSEAGNEESSIDLSTWNDDQHSTKTSIWKHKNKSYVPYEFDINVSNKCQTLFLKAVNEFNNKTPCKWIIYNSNDHKDYVTVVQNNSTNPHVCTIGRKGGQQFIYLPYPNYPTGGKLRLICVLHEMMHIIGFHHEMLRSDAAKHCLSNKHSTNRKVVSFGQYDYISIMNYANGVRYEAKNDEYARKADKGQTFSQGDLAAIRRIYGDNSSTGKPHFGVWHKECAPKCTKTVCKCGACGQLPGGQNCGYTGICSPFPR